MTGNSIMMIEMLLLLFKLLRVSLLSPRVFSFLLSCLGGAPKIDLPLSIFSLAISILTSLFSITLLLGGTKTAVLVEAILEEERPYPKPVRSEADF